jgi:hypothetical protein
MSIDARPMARRSARRRPVLTAKTADKHALYQRAVQAPDFEVELAARLFRRRAKRKGLSLREDFCGSALVCAAWVKSDPDRTATGVDLDASVLAWGLTHNIEPLGEGADRVTLLREDVRAQLTGARHDIVMAFNYSYFCFKTREELRGYFAATRSHLADDGMLLLDFFGGWEAPCELVEVRKIRGFEYVWERASFSPRTAGLRAHIHFRFPDGSELTNAFTYDWRLWTLPELLELLDEAGFGRVEVLMEDEDHDGRGDTTYRPRRDIPNDPLYEGYLLARVG